VDTSPTPASEGRDLLAGSSEETEALDSEAFDEMEWSDVQPTAESAGRDLDLRERVLELTAQSRRAPVIYLRGLLLLATREPSGALDTFGRLAPEEIPALHLYAPYRLYGYLHPKTPNPYLPPLERAIAAKRVPALIEARVEAHEGDLQRALGAYLRSDPGLWTKHDLEVFQGMLQHAGLANEAGIMLRAALRGGRIEPPLQTNIMTLLMPADADASQDALRARLSEYLLNNPQGRKLATAATARQLDLRKRFVERDYRGLLEDHRLADPVSLPNETVLFLFLAAAHEKDATALDRWSQEVKRRVPTAEVQEWVKQITGEAK
jgi:hypothetical protein